MFVTRRDEFVYIMFYEDRGELDAASNQPLTWKELFTDGEEEEQEAVMSVQDAKR